MRKLGKNCSTSSVNREYVVIASRHRCGTPIMSGLPLRHRAAEDRLVLLVHHWPRPVATVQHITMPGACSELGTTTSPATPCVLAGAVQPWRSGSSSKARAVRERAGRGRALRPLGRRGLVGAVIMYALFENQIGDAGISTLAGAIASGSMANLRILRLDSNEIVDTGMSALAGTTASGSAAQGGGW